MDVANPDGLLKPDELATMTLTGHADQQTHRAQCRHRPRRKPGLRVRAERPPDLCAAEVSLGDEENDRRVVLSGVGQENTSSPTAPST